MANLKETVNTVPLSNTSGTSSTHFVTVVPVKTLHAKLADIANEVGKLRATSKNQYGKTALGIADVENELRDHFAKQRVLTFWNTVEVRPLNPENKLFIAQVQIVLRNADDATDEFIGQSIDVGSNPMAASSFAVKGFYKRLFHLADDEDEGKTKVYPAQTSRPVTNAQTVRSEPTTRLQNSPRDAVSAVEAFFPGSGTSTPARPKEDTEAMGPLAYIEGYPCVVEGCEGVYKRAQKGPQAGNLICVKDVEGVKKWGGHVAPVGS